MKKVVLVSIDCSTCINSVLIDGVLHCETKIKDWNDIKNSSIVSTVKECGLFKIKKWGYKLWELDYLDY